jgi:energy-coupling factor transporter ATP-binding protein EcfA2
MDSLTNAPSYWCEIVSFAIEFNNATFAYAGAKTSALKNVTLKIKQGESLLIAGPNAAGKTTLCRCLNGLVPEFFLGDLEGSILINGINSRHAGIGRLSQIAGLVFDDPTSQLVCSSVQDEVAFGAENLGVPREEIDKRVAEALRAVRLEGYESRFPQSLSGGEQQAVAIASIMAMDPEILVLDEPTSNLDPIGSTRVLSIISDLAKKEKKTLLVVSHNIEQLAGLTDRMVVLDNAEIVFDGSPQEVLQKGTELVTLGLSPPQVTVLFSRLQSLNFPFATGQIPMTIEEAYARLEKVRPKITVQVWKPPPPTIRSGENVIEVKGLSFNYPESQISALQDVSLEIRKNEFVAIIGQNGSGKSTLVKHFNGLLKPSKGNVRVVRIDTSQAPVWELSRKVGYVFQNPDLQLFNSTVRKEIGFSLRAIGVTTNIEQTVGDLAKKLGIEQYLDQSPGTLDKGGRQRVAIASVMALSPEVLVVDEPTTGQDPRNSRQIMDIAKALHSEGKTVVFITHNMEIVAEYAERGVLMWQGQVLFDGPVRRLFQETELLKKSFLEAPQVVRLAQMLKDHGFPPDILTVEEMAQFIKSSVGVS